MCTLYVIPNPKNTATNINNVINPISGLPLPPETPVVVIIVDVTVGEYDVYVDVTVGEYEVIVVVVGVVGLHDVYVVVVDVAIVGE